MMKNTNSNKFSRLKIDHAGEKTLTFPMGHGIDESKSVDNRSDIITRQEKKKTKKYQRE